MRVEDTWDYCRLLYLMQLPKYYQAVARTEFTNPEVDYEGIAGYIETKVVFIIKDLSLFAELNKLCYADNVRDTVLSIRKRVLDENCDY